MPKRRGKSGRKHDGPTLPGVLFRQLDGFDDGGTDGVPTKKRTDPKLDRKARRNAAKAEAAKKRQASAKWKADGAARRRESRQTSDDKRTVATNAHAGGGSKISVDDDDGRATT